MAKPNFNSYGLNNELEITNQPESPNNTIINKETVAQAVVDGINNSEKVEDPSEKLKREQLVTVLESIRASLEEMILNKQENENSCSITIAALNAILVNNDLDPLDESVKTLSQTKTAVVDLIKDISIPR